MNPEALRKSLRVVKIALVTLQVVIVAALILDSSNAVKSAKEVVLFEKLYGNWPAVFTISIFFLIFLFFLTRPRRPKEWKGAGLAAAFFISLFTEMFGIPFTIYLLAPLLGVEPGMFGMYESHLWAYFLSEAGILSLKAGVNLVMTLSTGLILLGFILLAAGWKRIYRGKGEPVTDGLYARLRHPQYLGLILIVIAFLIQWPTLLTVLLAPFLIGRYILLAREEDKELEERFGDDFKRYRENVPTFIPSIRG